VENLGNESTVPLADVKRLIEVYLPSLDDESSNPTIRPAYSSPAGARPLHLAVRAGDIEAARLLLQLGADPNIGDDMKYSPLSHAVWPAKFIGNKERTPDQIKEMVKLLMDFGANPNHRGSPSRGSPAEIARAEGYHDIVAFMRVESMGKQSSLTHTASSSHAR
jgi:ankyrin repeat protein